MSLIGQIWSSNWVIRSKISIRNWCECLCSVWILIEFLKGQTILVVTIFMFLKLFFGKRSETPLGFSISLRNIKEKENQTARNLSIAMSNKFALNLTNYTDADIDPALSWYWRFTCTPFAVSDSPPRLCNPVFAHLIFITTSKSNREINFIQLNSIKDRLLFSFTIRSFILWLTVI